VNRQQLCAAGYAALGAIGVVIGGLCNDATVGILMVGCGGYLFVAALFNVYKERK